MLNLESAILSIIDIFSKILNNFPINLLSLYELKYFFALKPEYKNFLNFIFFFMYIEIKIFSDLFFSLNNKVKQL